MVMYSEIIFSMSGLNTLSVRVRVVSLSGLCPVRVMSLSGLCKITPNFQAFVAYDSRYFGRNLLPKVSAPTK